jgi:hypothetical protein
MGETMTKLSLKAPCLLACLSVLCEIIEMSLVNSKKKHQFRRENGGTQRKRGPTSKLETTPKSKWEGKKCSCQNPNPEPRSYKPLISRVK